MKNCVYCNKELPKRQRKYCNTLCSTRFKEEGPAREQFVYKELELNVDMDVIELQHRVDTGTWMLFPAAQEDEQVIGDFMRVFKRAPQHVIFDPRTPLWKFAGPVWTEEELAYRWKGWEAEAKFEERSRKATKSSDLRSANDK